MKKSELKKIIREEVKRISEENELLKAQDSIKGVMFKIKKKMEPVLKDMKKQNIIDSYKQVVEPYNNGYELVFNIKANTFELYQINEELAKIISAINYINLKPTSFFQSDLERNEKTRIEGEIFKMTNSYNDYLVRYQIKSKKDIKLATNKYYKTVEKQIEKIQKLVNR